MAQSQMERLCFNQCILLLSFSRIARACIMCTAIGTRKATMWKKENLCVWWKETISYCFPIYCTHNTWSILTKNMQKPGTEKVYLPVARGIKEHLVPWTLRPGLPWNELAYSINLILQMIQRALLWMIMCFIMRKSLGKKYITF